MQMINEAGDKKFLSGQRTKLAVFPLGSGGRTILCEGFATGLSIRAALATIPGRHWIAVCFSTGNLLEVAKTRPGALVVADNDVSGTGQRVANDSKLPYWLSETEGHDFNDDMQALGVFQVSQSLRSALSQK
jgi:putative DNA primase/helicase